MGIKTVVLQQAEVIVCDITGEVISAGDIAYSVGEIIISRKAWEQIPKNMRDEPFLTILLMYVLHPGNGFPDVSVGFWVLSESDWPMPRLCNYKGRKNKDDLYRSEEDIMADLNTAASYSDYGSLPVRTYHIFKDGKYLYTITQKIKIVLEKSFIGENCDDPKIITR